MSTDSQSLPLQLEAKETRKLVAAAYSSPIEHTDANPPQMLYLPPWIRRYGLLAGKAGTWLWCEPCEKTAENATGQFVLDVPAGRYLIDILDIASHTWISKESAEGGPLVAGLLCTSSPVLVCIRPQES